MADTVTSQVLANGPRNLIIKRTNVSDGTGETGAVFVDATSTTYSVEGQVPGVHLKVVEIVYDVYAGWVRLQWDASSAVDMTMLTGFGRQKYRRSAGLVNPNAAGATGSILLTTENFALGSAYSITIYMTKNVPTF